MVIPVELGETRVETIVDSGAESDFIDAKMAEQLKLEVKPLKGFQVGTAAEDEPGLQIQGFVQLKFKLCGMELNRLLFVVPNLRYDIYLGLGFCAEFQDSIDFHARTINGVYIDHLREEQNEEQKEKQNEEEKKNQNEEQKERTVPDGTIKEAAQVEIKRKGKIWRQQSKKKVHNQHLTEESQDRAKLVIKDHDRIKNLTDSNKEAPESTKEDHDDKIEETAEPGELATTIMMNNIELNRCLKKAETDVAIVLVKANSLPIKEEQVIPKFIEEEFSDVVTDELPRGLPPERPITHTITLIPGKPPPHKAPYRLTWEEKQELEVQISELLEKGFIVPQASPYGAPVIFVKKKDGSKRLCVDYRALNDITVKERFPIPLIDELFDSLSGATIFSTLDLHLGYHQVAIAKEDQEKTAFVTRFGQYAWKVMPFGLCNAPATFQRLMNDIFMDTFDKYLNIYLDDLIIYSRDRESHEKHVREVLTRLRKNGLIAKKKKCHFFQSSVKYLGHIITDKGIEPDEEKIAAIKNWPPIKSVKQAQSFLGLVGYYRKFIPQMSALCGPIHDFIAGKLNWGTDQQEGFDKLRESLTKSPILILPSQEDTFVVFTDASNLCSGAVLHQVDSAGTFKGVVAYDSYKFGVHELKYTVREKECLAVVKALRKWKHYLAGRRFILYTDHESLRSLHYNKDAFGRINRWIGFLAEYDMEIRHIKGSRNSVADAISRAHINEICVQPVEMGISVMLVQELDPVNVTEIKEGYKADSAFSKIYTVLKDKLEIPVELTNIVKHYVLVDELLYFGLLPSEKIRLCIPAGNIRNQLLYQAHDTTASAHQGALKMHESISRNYYWPKLFRSCRQYTDHCTTCQRSKASTVKTAGLLNPLPVPKARWLLISIDFLTGIPTTAAGYNMLMAVVDRLTKRAHFIPTVKTATAVDVAQLLLLHVVKYHGMPHSIVSDRDVRFNNSIWRTLTERLGISLKMSTSHNPQTDGQTERLNRVVKQMLQAICQNHPQDWDSCLPAAEFGYNNSYQASIKCTPFYADLGFHPRYSGVLAPASSFDAQASVLLGEDFADHQHQVIRVVQERMFEAQQQQMNQVDPHRGYVIFQKGDLVLLHRDILGGGEQDKFNFRYIGPYEVIEKVNDNSYKIKLPPGSRMHDTINVRHLRKYNPRVKDYINVPPTEAEEIRRNIEEVSSIVRVFEDGSCEVTWTDCDINNTLRIPLVWLQQDDKKWRKLKKQFLETYGQSLECNPEEERESINPPVVIPEEIRSRSELDFASRRVHALSQKKMASGDPRFQPKPTPRRRGPG